MNPGIGLQGEGIKKIKVNVSVYLLKKPIFSFKTLNSV